MSLAALGLRQAIHALLSADAALLAMTGAGKLLDRPAQGTALPFILHGLARTEDYSTATEAGEEHFLSLDIWTDTGGQKRGLEIAARIHALVDNASLNPPGVVLVSLSYLGTRCRREARSRAIVCEVQFRAVTE